MSAHISGTDLFNGSESSVYSLRNLLTFSLCLNDKVDVQPIYKIRITSSYIEKNTWLFKAQENITS
jgi:hypothetical protein